MITFQGKQVIVAAVDSSGLNADVHYVEALGTTRRVSIESLRSDTIDELEAALGGADVVPEHPADWCDRHGVTLD